MRSFACGLAALAMATAALAQYGDISTIKLLKPEDKDDIRSVPPPKDAIVLFDGKSLDGWVKTNGKDKAPWELVNGAMQVKGGSIRTEKTFPGPYKLHVEYRVPSTGGSNSGVYVQGRYEIQVNNDYGRSIGKNSNGSIYGVAAPTVNACKAPTVWQSFDIDFQPPKCDGDKVLEPGLLTVWHNGVKIHDKVAIDKPTGGALGGKISEPGPLMLQDHGGPVQYRNIWILPMK